MDGVKGLIYPVFLTYHNNIQPKDCKEKISKNKGISLICICTKRRPTASWELYIKWES